MTFTELTRGVPTLGAFEEAPPEVAGDETAPGEQVVEVPFGPVEVQVRDYKRPNLAGGVLVVAVPQVGMAGVLLTDWMLEFHHMDQIAAVDSDALPPIALMRDGKARFPIRIHADAKRRIAVLRSELPLFAQFARPMSRAIMKWAKARKIARVVVLDGIVATGEDKRPQGVQRVWCASCADPARDAARKTGVPGIDQGTLAGLPAMMLLEGRFAHIDVMALFAETTGPLSDAGSMVEFAKALPDFVPNLEIDLENLEATRVAIEKNVNDIRQATDRELDLLRRRRDPSPAYQ